MSTFNSVAFQFIYRFAHQSMTRDVLGIFLAEYLPYFLVAAFLILVYQQDGWRRRVYLFSEGTLAIILARGVVTSIIKFFYYHPRPFDALGFVPLIPESGASFPSGHMAWFFALAVVVWCANRSWGIWFFILSLLMGVARIYVGVHWPLDILGGIAMGIASGLLVHWLFRDSRQRLYP